MKSSRLLLSSCSAIAALTFASSAMAGEIVGTIVDETDTIPLQSAQVRIVELDRVATTDRSGNFIFGDVPEGTYTLEARYVGAMPERVSLAVPASGAARADFALGGENAAEILVVGQGANQASALSRKRESDTVSDVLTRDGIGQFPDQNVAESLRRLPGINVLDDQGEGRFVAIRGLDPDLNSTLINGVRLPSPESDVRGVALDVVSSDIVESIEVKKTLTPDMDADTIGGTIEINTVSAFDRRKDYYSASLEGSYNDYSGKLTPKASVDFATRLGDDIGVSGGLSYYLRKFETDNIEADDWEDDDGLIYAETVEYRDYDVERERISASLGFDWRASNTTEIYLRGLWSQFDDQEYRRRTTFDFGDAHVSGSGNSVQFADADPSEPDEEYATTVERDLKDRFERQRIRSVSLGGETDTGTWKAEYALSWAKSSEKEDDSLDPVKFEREFENDGLVVGMDYSNPRIPLYSIVNDPGDFFDASTYELDDIELTDLSAATDTEYTAKFDLGREFATDSGTITVQAGFKGRWREKKYDKNVGFYENDDFLLSDVEGEQTYRITNISPVANYHGSRDYFFANMDDFEFQEVDSAFDSAVEDYVVEENVVAGYALGRWDSDTLRVIGGVRVEHTKNDMIGNDVILVEEDGTLPDGSVALEDTVIVTPGTYARDYTHWLPSLNVRFEPQQDLVLRLAGYRSLVRPKLSSLAPRFAVEVNDDDEVEGEFGNPYLKPYDAWNFDASAEYYFSSNGALSLAVFYKDIKDYIVDVEYEAEDLNGNDEIDPEERLVYRGIAFDEAVIPFNGDSAEVYGVEVGVAQQWTMLPAPFDGLITQANYTYTDATGLVSIAGGTDVGGVGETREIPLPSTSKNTFNAVLGYEKGRFSFRLAGTYRDKYLDEISGSPEDDRYVADHFQLDLSAKYRVTDNVQVFYEWVNLNNAKYFAYNTIGGRQNIYQYEQYNWTMKFGAKASF